MDPKSAHKSYHAGHKNFIPEDKILKYGFLFVVPGLLLISVLYLVFYQTQLLYHPNSTNSSVYLSPTPYPTTNITEPIDTSTWKIFTYNDISFQYASDRKINKTQYEDYIVFEFITNSNIQLLFEDWPNINPATKKPYTSLYKVLTYDEKKEHWKMTEINGYQVLKSPQIRVNEVASHIDNKTYLFSSSNKRVYKIITEDYSVKPETPQEYEKMISSLKVSK